MKGILMIVDIEMELRETKMALTEAANAHTKAVLTAESLDALVLSQPTSLRATVKI